MSTTSAIQTSNRSRGRAGGVSWLADVVVRRMAHALNPLIARFAGARFNPVVALLYHRGRSTGRVYATPVSARPWGAGFIIPLTFGETAQWCRNILAAGTCGVRWKGSEYVLSDPEVVDMAALIRDGFRFSPFERVFIRVAGIRRALHMRVAVKAPVE
jgi:hypothetical protein